LKGTRERRRVDSKLVAHVRSQQIQRAQLLRDLQRQRLVEPTLDADAGRLGQLGPTASSRFSSSMSARLPAGLPQAAES
jgi:Zn-dependent M28 family amino/carboxypeptidase